MPFDDRGAEGQLRRGERECLARDFFRDAGNLVKEFAGLDLGDPVLDVALALTLPHFERLLGDRLVGKHANPNVAAALDEARHRAPRRLDLASRQLAAVERLQAVVAKRDGVAALGQATVAALELLAEFCAFRLQHVLSLCLRGRRPRRFAGLRSRRLGRGVLTYLAAENPNFDADDAVGRASLGEA